MNKVFKICVVILGVLILTLPIYLYINQFGIGVWKEHQEWGVMGSYFGGVMGPLITSISIVFLGYQIREQRLQRNLEFIGRQSRQHEKDLLNLIPKLSTILKSEPFYSSVKFTMINYDKKVYLGDREGAKNEVKKLVKSYFREFHVWLAIDLNYRDLAKVDYSRYKKVTYYLLSECELECLHYLNKVSNSFCDINNEVCTFINKT